MVKFIGRRDTDRGWKQLRRGGNLPWGLRLLIRLVFRVRFLAASRRNELLDVVAADLQLMIHGVFDRSSQAEIGAYGEERK